MIRMTRQNHKRPIHLLRDKSADDLVWERRGTEAQRLMLCREIRRQAIWTADHEAERRFATIARRPYRLRNSETGH